MNTSGFLSLVLIIEGAALMAVELLGAKLLAPFYGSSLYVWTAVLGIAVLGLTLGYHFGGTLSRRHASEQRLVIIISMAALLVVALPYTTSLVITLTSGMALIPGICIACFLVLFPPMLCFGMVGPMVVRLTASRLAALGRVAGTVYFTSTLGGIIATFLFGFYLIPGAGLRFCTLITAVALASLPVIYIVKTIVSGNTDITIAAVEEDRYRPRATSRKVKPVVYVFAVLEGASVMAIELIAARMLAPYFGSSLYVWGAVIGVTLSSLALGYYLGGVLADSYTQLNTVLWVLMASVCVLLMHYSSQRLTMAFADMAPVPAVALISLFLVLPPLLFLGMVPTLLIRYVSTNVDDAGAMTGRVYTISSASGIFALPLTGFYVIPAFGLTTPSIVIGVIIGIVPFFKLLGHKQYASLLFPVCVLLSLSARTTAQSTADVKIQYYSEGVLGQVLVADVYKKGTDADAVKANDRILFVNRMGQTFVDKTTGLSQWPYLTFAWAVGSKLPANSSVLLLGLGGGSVANVFHDNLNFSVDAVELDDRIAEVASDYFGLSPNVHVIVDDARHYIETTGKKYDLIFFDVFKGDIQPAHVLSLECFRKSKTLLNSGGLMLVNFNGFMSGEIGKPGRSVYMTLQAAGLDTKILLTPGTEDQRSTLFVASAGPEDYNNLRYPLQRLGKAVDMESLFVDSTTLNLENAIVFVDDKPILDRMNIGAAGMWRKAYNQTYTRLFVERGIPLFQ